MNFIKKYYQFIGGAISGIIPYFFGYSIITWQWWAIAIPLSIVGLFVCHKVIQ